ncbi:four-carbon acid sugar kinase family protein [Paenibacillus abyssi]|uniref:Type III effector n=1 Tax=Paenibacillus abyssi TaxID=1340531 RepID=A0A917CVZ2_9BACL|nr:four-carbon acid sugar kinase family protein [Paenibacillus abyssi]GGG00133.1 hypothetical protein GCM10010916_16700 [Paenibacillus abyssi]
MNSKIMLGFYGDDFTGSTDAMEALTLSGIRTVLFLEPPSVDIINESFSTIQAFGIAGVSRSLNQSQMEDELRPAFKALKDSGALICHYKTCSTFDSSSDVGSIGKAMEIGKEIFDSSQTFIPLVVGVPRLNRFTVFGNHFATVNGTTYRLDRHPVMSKHPVTPMHEAELLEHLKEQTNLSSGLVNILDLSNEISVVKENIAEKKKNHDLLLFDVLDETNLKKIGEILLDEAAYNQLFAVGSSGIEYALTAAWKKSTQIDTKEPTFTNRGQSEPMLVVSGSCSAVTKAQIDYAKKNGFTCIRVSGEELLYDHVEHVRNRFIDQVNELLNKGENVVVYSALGPDDPSIENVRKKLNDLGRTSTDTGQFLGEQLGKMTKEIIENQKVTRLVVAGGDTSGYVLKELEIYAMEMVMPITPGGPLCKTYSNNKKFDGLEVCLKGGQVGGTDFFVKVKNG